MAPLSCGAAFLRVQVGSPGGNLQVEGPGGAAWPRETLTVMQPPQASPHGELRGWVALQGCSKQGEGLGLCVLDQSGYGSRQGSCLQLRVFLERLCPRRVGTISPVQKGGPAGGHTVNQVHSAYLVGSRGLCSSRQGGREGRRALVFKDMVQKLHTSPPRRSLARTRSHGCIPLLGVAVLTMDTHVPVGSQRSPSERETGRA